MKNHARFLISALFLLNHCAVSFAQTDSNSGNQNDLYQSVINEYGFDQVLVNGVTYQDDYHGTIGHPFYLENQFYKGTLVFRNREYREVDLKYDIYKQQVILYIRQNNLTTWLIPPNDFISAFNLGDKKFRKFNFQGTPEFYQVIVDAKDLKCLYSWSKLRFDSNHNEGYNSSRFTDSERKTYLVIENTFSRYTDNKSFVRLFPQELRLQIKQYIQNNNIKVAWSSDSEIERLLIFCQSLFAPSFNQKPDSSMVSGNFINTPFDNFVENIEKNTAFRFFYLPEWVSNITMNFSETNIELSALLNKQLKNTNLSFFIDGNNIYIFPGSAILTDLPDYSGPEVKNYKPGGITETEKKYIEGNQKKGIDSVKNELIEINEVKISAYRNDNIKGTQMGYERISAKTMKEIPVVFGEKDVLKVAQMLPGVLNVGEGSSGFNVRGSSSDQNMFYFNKVPVYNTSHLFGFFTSFNPDVINDFTLYKGNIPASYGGRLASVFNITTRQGSKKKFFSQGGISPVTSHFSLEVPVIRNKVSMVISGRSSYSDWILKKIKDEDIRKSNAFFYDGTFSVNAEINDKNLLKAFGYISRDRFSLSSINDYNYLNTGSSLVWKHMFSSLKTMDVSIIYSGYSFENINKTNLSTAFKQQYALKHYEFRSDFSLISKANHKFELGTGAIFYNLDRGCITPFGEESLRTEVDLGKENALEYAVYLSDEFTLFKNITVLSGLRYSLFNQLGPASINKYYPEKLRTVSNIKETRSYHKGELIKSYSGPEYRMAINYVLNNDNSLKASYNRMYQYIFMLSNTIAVSPDDKWKICDYHISPPVADQVSAGYYRNFAGGGIKASLEIYHKWINNQVEYKDGTDFTSPDPIETKVLQGKQHVSGIEMMISKNTGKTTGWLSYCYSRSLVKVDGGEDALQINYGIESPSNYDRPHSLNIVFNYRASRRISLSSDFVYTSGRPITYPVSVYYAEGQEMLQFSKRNEYRIPDYTRLDLSLKLEGNLFKKKVIHSYWTLNLYNALGRRNAYSVYYSAKNGKVYGHKLSIFGVPLLTLSWNYKFGNYLND